MKKMIQLTVTLTAIAAIAGVSISAMYDKTAVRIEEQKTEKVNSALKSLFSENATIFKDSLKLESGETFDFWIAKDTTKEVQPEKDTIEVADTTVDGDTLSTNTKIVETTVIDPLQSIIGVAFQGGEYGYSSVVRYLAATTLSGEVLGISVLSQEETPGLGSRSTESVSTETFWSGGLFKKTEKQKPWFQAQFTGISIKDTIRIDTKAEWHTLSEENKAELRGENTVSAITGATITTKAVTNALFTQSSILTAISVYLSEKGGKDGQ